MILIYIVLEKKEKDIMDIKEKALIIIPELEERFEIDMSIESFEKNDLVRKDEGTYTQKRRTNNEAIWQVGESNSK